MGEYARRVKDGSEVKIGTCESLYYLRYDQREEVDYDFGNYKWFWRIPTPDEDHLGPGEFESRKPLKDGKYIPSKLRINDIKGELADSMASHTGIVQTRVEQLGMLINAPCHHGLKLPENGNGFKFFWNGKTDALYLSFLANHEKELRVGIECAACGKMFSFPFTEAKPLIKSLWMRLRLLRACTEYWGEHNSEPCDYSVEHGGLEIYNLTGRSDDWNVYENDEPVASGNWQLCRNAFIEKLSCPADDDENAWRMAAIRGEDGELYEIREMKKRYL